MISPVFYKAFQVQIKAMYVKYEEQNAFKGLSLSEEELRAYVHNTITETLKLEDATAFTDDAGFFSIGLNSLRSIHYPLFTDMFCMILLTTGQGLRRAVGTGDLVIYVLRSLS